MCYNTFTRYTQRNDHQDYADVTTKISFHGAPLSLLSFLHLKASFKIYWEFLETDNGFDFVDICLVDQKIYQHSLGVCIRETISEPICIRRFPTIENCQKKISADLHFLLDIFCFLLILTPI